MSSASYGLPTDYALGYDSAIPLAVRLSNSGIFAHSAPWSVADQGIRNVSHGCINMPPDQAQWFYDTFSSHPAQVLDRRGFDQPADATWHGEFPWQNLAFDGFERTAPVGSFPVQVLRIAGHDRQYSEWTSGHYTPKPLRSQHRQRLRYLCGPTNPRTSDPDGEL